MQWEAPESIIQETLKVGEEAVKASSGIPATAKEDVEEPHEEWSD